MPTKTILVVDDEAPIRDMLRVALEMSDFDVLEAENARIAHGIIVDKRPDLILLDWMMPNTSGIEFARRLRRDEITENIPIIMLTAKGEEDNKVQALDLGVDDYVTKPFAARELISRVRALLRRSDNTKHNEVLEISNLQLNLSCHRVTIGDTSIAMGPTEYRLLEFFMTHQERVYSRNQLLDHVWGGNVYVEERTIDVHIRRLRKALSPEGHDRFIQTVRGSGYRFSSKLTAER